MFYVHVDLFQILLLCSDPFLIVFDAEVEYHTVILIPLRDQLGITYEHGLNRVESQIIWELIRLLNLKVCREDLYLATLKTHYKRKYLGDNLNQEESDSISLISIFISKIKVCEE